MCVRRTGIECSIEYSGVGAALKGLKLFTQDGKSPAILSPLWVNVVDTK